MPNEDGGDVPIPVHNDDGDIPIPMHNNVDKYKL